MEQNEEEGEKIEFERESQKKSDALKLSCLETSIDDDDNATPCDSSLTSDDSVLAHRLKLMDAAATPCHEIQLKVIFRLVFSESNWFEFHNLDLKFTSDWRSEVLCFAIASFSLSLSLSSLSLSNILFVLNNFQIQI